MEGSVVKDDMSRVQSLVKNLESSIRSAVQKKIGSNEASTEGIEVINFTPLHGMCGDKVIGVNMKYGSVYYHIYILDESVDPQLVKVLGPKEVSAEVTGFN